MKFSTKEDELLRLIPKDGTRISSKDLIDKYYGKKPPFNARAITIDRLRSIAAKAEAQNLSWRLIKGPRTGPHPMEFHIEHQQT